MVVLVSRRRVQAGASTRARPASSTCPADYKLEVVETPPPLRASIDGAAYYPAPPFKNTGVGRFYVTPTGNDPAALQSNNRAALADLSAHEGFPGHDWYYKVLTQARDNVSPVRWLTPGAVEDSSSMWEDSMASRRLGPLCRSADGRAAAAGAERVLHAGRTALPAAGQALSRSARPHRHRYPHRARSRYDDATTLFSEVVDFLPGSATRPDAPKSDAKRASCEAAERAIFRYSKWPTQAITYRLGKDQIYALREEAAKQLGAAFSLKAFHLRVHPPGNDPAGILQGRAAEGAARSASAR